MHKLRKAAGGVLKNRKGVASVSASERRANAVRDLTKTLRDVYEGIFERVNGLPHALPAKVLKIMVKLERSQGKEVAHDAVCLLMCSLDGLTEPEIQALLHLDPKPWVQVKKILKPILKAYPVEGSPFPRLRIDVAALFPKMVALTGAVLSEESEVAALGAKAEADEGMVAGLVADDGEDRGDERGGTHSDARGRYGMSGIRRRRSQAMNRRLSDASRVSGKSDISIALGISDSDEEGPGAAGGARAGSASATGGSHGLLTLRATIDASSRAAWELVRNKAKLHYNVALATFFAERAMGAPIAKCASKVDGGTTFQIIQEKARADVMTMDGGASGAGSHGGGGGGAYGIVFDDSDDDMDLRSRPGTADRRIGAVEEEGDSARGGSAGSADSDDAFVSAGFTERFGAVEMDPAARRAAAGRRGSADGGSGTPPVDGADRPGTSDTFKSGMSLMSGKSDAYAAFASDSDGDEEQFEGRFKRPKAAPTAEDIRKKRLRSRARFLWNQLRKKLAKGVPLRQQQRARYRRGCARLAAVFRRHQKDIHARAVNAAVVNEKTGNAMANVVVHVPTTAVHVVAQGRGRGASLVKAKRVGRWVYSEPECVAALRALPHHLLRAQRTTEAYKVLTDIHFVEAVAHEGADCLRNLIDDLFLLKTVLEEKKEEMEDKDMATMVREQKGKIATDMLIKLVLAAGDIDIGGEAAHMEAMLGFGVKIRLRRLKKRLDFVNAMLEFVRADTGTLTHFPSTTYQMAANMPGYSPLSTASLSLWKDKREDRQFLRWVNKPQHKDACLMTLPGTAQGTPINCVRFSNDGRFVGSATADGQVVVLSLKTGNVLAVLRSLAEQAWQKDFAVEEAMLNKKIAKHEASEKARREKGLPPQAYHPPDVPKALRKKAFPAATVLTFRPTNSRFIISGTDRGEVFLWDRANQACKELKRGERSSDGPSYPLLHEEEHWREARRAARREATVKLLVPKHWGRMDLVEDPGDADEAAEGAGEGKGAEAGATDAGETAGDGAAAKTKAEATTDPGAGAGAARARRKSSAAGAAGRRRSSVAKAQAFEAAKARREEMAAAKAAKKQAAKDVKEAEEEALAPLQYEDLRPRAHAARVTAAEWSRNGTRLVTGDAIGVVVVWAFDDAKVWDMLSTEQPRTLMRWKAHSSPVQSVAFGHAGWAAKVEAEVLLDGDDEELVGTQRVSSRVVPSNATGTGMIKGSGLATSASFGSIPVRRAALGPAGTRTGPAGSTGSFRSASRGGGRPPSGPGDPTMSLDSVNTASFAAASATIQAAAATGGVMKSHRRTMFQSRTPVHEAPAGHDMREFLSSTPTSSTSTGGMPSTVRSASTFGLQDVPRVTMRKGLTANPVTAAGIRPTARHVNKIQRRIDERKESQERRDAARLETKRNRAAKKVSTSYAARKWARAPGAKLRLENRPNQVVHQPPFSPLRSSSSLPLIGSASPGSPASPGSFASTGFGFGATGRSDRSAGERSGPPSATRVTFVDEAPEADTDGEPHGRDGDLDRRRGRDAASGKAEADGYDESKAADADNDVRPVTGGSLTRSRAPEMVHLEHAAATKKTATNEALATVLDMSHMDSKASGDTTADAAGGGSLLAGAKERDGDDSDYSAPDSDSDEDGVPGARLHGQYTVITAGQSTTYVWRLSADEKAGRQIGQTSGLGLALHPQQKRLSILLQRSNKIAKLVTSRGERVPLQEKEGSKIRDAAFSVLRERVAVVCEDMSLRVYRTDNGKRVGKMHGHSEAVNTVAYGPDGRLVATGGDDGTVRVWQPDILPEATQSADHSGLCLEAKFTTTDEGAFGGQMVTVGSDGSVKLWLSDEATTWGKHEVVRDFGLNIRGALFSLDGSKCVVVSSGGVRVWESNPNSPQSLRFMSHDIAEEHTIALFACDPQCLVIAFTDVDGMDGLHTLDMRTSKLRAKFAMERAPDMRLMMFSPDSRILVTTDVAGTVCLWDISIGRHAAGSEAGTQFMDKATGRIAGGSKASGGASGWNRLPMAELNDRMANSPAMRNYTKFKFSNSGSFLTCLSKDPLGSFTVWKIRRAVADKMPPKNIADSNEHNIVRFFGHIGNVEDTCWSPDDRYIVTGSADGTLRVWDFHEQLLLRTITAHEGRAVTYCKWANINDRLFSSGSDRSVRIWHPLTGVPLAVWQLNAVVTSLDVNTLGSKIIVGDFLGDVKVLSYTQQPVEKGPGGDMDVLDMDDDSTDLTGITAVAAAPDRIARRKGAFSTFRATSGAGAHTRGKHFASGSDEIPFITPKRMFAADRSQWMAKLTFSCANCAQVFQAYERLLARADAIAAKISTFGPLDSYFNDPRLMARCTSCKQTHRVTPFYMDNPWGLEK